ncbi:MAG: IS66 family insertion sequence element accessory protein TnpB [Acidobacteriota bacterium]|nr:IS66 family insertion sequence element accessory protein TnpB [Acidobacteriota bacterium]
MRKGFEGLHGLVRDHLGQDPLSGHLFLFTNKTKTRLKAIVWDGSGLWVCAKRLEKGRFRWPTISSNDDKVRSLTMRAEELAMLASRYSVPAHSKMSRGCFGPIMTGNKKLA